MERQFPFHQRSKSNERVWLKFCSEDILTVQLSSSSIIWGKYIYTGSFLVQTSSLPWNKTQAFLTEYKSNVQVQFKIWQVRIVHCSLMFDSSLCFSTVHFICYGSKEKKRHILTIARGEIWTCH